MAKTKEEKWRKEIKELSDEDLDNELQKPRLDYGDMVLREALRRLLNSRQMRSTELEA